MQFVEEKMKVNAIAAMGKNRQIGLNGKLPWHDQSELVHFKWSTLDQIVIMGRKTYESIGKPLSGRHTIVVSSKGGENKSNLFFVRTPQEAIELAKFMKGPDDFRQVWVCGGSSIYEALLPYISTFTISQMEYDGEADTYLPEFEKDFHCSSMVHAKGEKFKIYTYERVK